jgi:hypothetical protein
MIFSNVFIGKPEDEIKELHSLIMDLRQSNSQLEYAVEELAKSENKISIPAIVTSMLPLIMLAESAITETLTTPAPGKMPGPITQLLIRRDYPYGTRLYIPGYGIVIIQDTGGALIKDKNNIRIDVFHETFKEAMEWGEQPLEVIILD